MDTKVIDRIKKMITLGNDAGATEHERETALRMAYNTMAKHNLTMADLPEDEKGEDRVRGEVTICGDKWIRVVCNSVSKLFFCKYFYCRTGVSGKEMHCFIGLESNVATAKAMSEFVVKSIKREATARFRSPTSPEGRSFGVGASHTIFSRVETMLKEDTVESTPGTALVLVRVHEQEQAANDLWLANDGVKLKTPVARSSPINRSAYHSGKDFGNTVSLNKQVGGTSSRKTLK